MLQAAGEKLSNDKISFTGCEVYDFEVYEREDYLLGSWRTPVPLRSHPVDFSTCKLNN